MTRRISLAFMLASVCVLAGVHARAQSDGKPLAFEVASIKPSAPGSRVTPVTDIPDGYARRYTALIWFVADAYGVSPRQIVGVPPALTTARFDLTAKTSFVLTPEQRRQMLQRLLAERFALRAHRETRNLEVYALRLGKNFGPSSKGFKQTNVDCAEIKAERAKADGHALPTLNAFGGPVCSSFMYAGDGPPGADHLIGSGVTMAELVGNLAGIVNRVVIDETNLPGFFDVDLIFDRSSARATSAVVTGLTPSFFTAASESGLRLDGITAPVDVVVIDHAEPPTKD